MIVAAHGVFDLRVLFLRYLRKCRTALGALTDTVFDCILQLVEKRLRREGRTVLEKR